MVPLLDPFDIERVESPEWPASGQWRLLLRNGTKTALVACPGCGLVGSIADTHTVDASGAVRPSLWCSECGFHEWVRLVGWEP